MTPTLAKEELPPDKLFEARNDLLISADCKERDRFREWLHGHELFRSENGGDEEVLHSDIASRIGFPEAKKMMRQIMLEDTIKRLPDVLQALRWELDRCRKELKEVDQKLKFTDPGELRTITTRMVFELRDRLQNYLDGDLESALLFPEKLQTLDDEINAEEESDWADRELNYHTEREDEWRDRIAQLECFPEEVQADRGFLGGKQYQRAIAFFRAVMIDALPDPFKLKELAANATGFLAGGLQRENWERGMVQITSVCMKDISHPGVNYLVKHAGCILRRLFSLAMDDIKQGKEFSATFKLLPSVVEKQLKSEFDDFLWHLMTDAAEKTHCCMEPMYSTINPNLPTFREGDIDLPSDDNDEEKREGLILWAQRQLTATFLGTSEAKEHLKKESRSRATSKKRFLSDERTSMITDEETLTILHRAFHYIVALMDFNLVISTFLLNHYLFIRFKKEAGEALISKVSSTNWAELCQPDPYLLETKARLVDQMKSLIDSLNEVEAMHMRL